MDTSSKPWLEIDEDMYEVIVGNQAGLEELRSQIDNAIQSNESEYEIKVDGIGLQKIVLTDDKSYFSNSENYKPTTWEKIIPVMLFIWLIVLPISAIGFLIKAIFF